MVFCRFRRVQLSPTRFHNCSGNVVKRFAVFYFGAIVA